MTAPLFSVLVPVYNKLPYIERCVNSVLNQRFTDYELILVDDSSSDGTYQKMETFQDSRIKLFRRDTPGPAGNAAREYGINQATGRWIAFLDADDQWKSDFLEAIAAGIEAQPEIHFFCSGFEVDNGTRTSTNYYYKKFHHKGGHTFSLEEFLIYKPCHTSSTVIRREFLKEKGGFYKGESHRCGDVETWLRIMTHCREGYWVDCLGAVYYNQIPGSVIHTMPSYLFEHPVRHHALQQLKQPMSKGLKEAYKRHSNSFILTTIKHRVKAGKINPWDFRALFYASNILKRRNVLMFFLSFLPRPLRLKLFK